MHCQYCGARLPLLRDSQNGEFCSGAHREAWERLQHECEADALAPDALEKKPLFGPALCKRMFPLRRISNFQPGPRMVRADSGPLWRVETRPVRFKGELTGPPEMVAGGNVRGGALLRTWNGTPRGVRALVFLLPLAVLLAWHFGGGNMTAPAHSTGGRSRGRWNRNWTEVRQTLLSRAAIDLSDDFRGGLDDWVSGTKATPWRYDSNGFVMPTGLALYRPTLHLSDYHLEFLAQLQKKGMGWVVRASDSENYQAVRLIVTRPGPLPLAEVEHFAVVGGVQTNRVIKPLPMTIRTDMMYRARMDVQGDDFTLIIQGQIVDFWTDGRLKRGGVGFFCQKGEIARVRWVDVSHHYDTLGRLCAYLAPFGMSSTSGSWNQ